MTGPDGFTQLGTGLLESTDTAAEVIRDLALSTVEPAQVSETGVYLITTPPGSDSKLLDVTTAIEKGQPQPSRRRGTAQLSAAASLVQYIGMHQGPGTALFADEKRLQIVAVFNGAHEHPSEEAALAAAAALIGDPAGRPRPSGWGDFRAVLQLEHTPEWLHWLKNDGKLLPQQVFAEHVEMGLREIIDPPGADMLELAQSLEGSTSVEWKSAERLADGQRKITFDETTTAKAGQRGDLTIPASFTLGIKPFADLEEAYAITARFRYRIVSGALQLGYVLDRPDRVQRDAWAEVVKVVDSGTAFTTYHGTPPA